MNCLTIADGVIVFFIAVAITLFEAIQELLTIFQKGICINQRDLLLSKTNKELRAMLVGVKSLSSKNKKQLVELVLIQSWLVLDKNVATNPTNIGARNHSLITWR